jgi:lipopolysaccharide export system protein LptA
MVGSTIVAGASLRAQEEKVINLENADHLEGKIIDGEQARELIGNVRFSQAKVRVSCDRALQYLGSGKVFLTGNVVVTDDSVTMRAPRGVYYRDERLAEAFDSVTLDDGKVRLTARYGEYFVEPKRAFFRTRVVVKDTGSTVVADSLTYFRKEKRSVATGNVGVYNEADHVMISGRHLEHFSERQFTRITEQPVLVKFDTVSPGTFDTLVVRSRIMESYRDSVKRLLAIDSVEIVRSNLAGTAGFAEYFSETDSIRLRDSPIIWYQQTQVTGDSINVSLKARKLDRVHVMGHSFAVSQSDSLWPNRYDQITGERMIMQFADQRLDNIDVQNRAISVYHLYDDSTANGLNKTSGDRIVMLFEKGKVKSIHVLGGVEGQYFPENMVQGKELEYAIPGFMLHTNRPRIHASDFSPKPAAAAQKNGGVMIHP